MNDRVDFHALADRAVRAGGDAVLRPAIEKELLHYDILFYLDQAGWLDELTFQGGTALRLCFGATRLSDDLDFVGGSAVSQAYVEGIKSCLEGSIGARYGLDVGIKGPPTSSIEAMHSDAPAVSTWQLSIITAPGRPDIPRQRIKLQVANVPAYSRSPRPMMLNYDFLPDGYGDVLIMTETLEELMADKLVALINTQRHVRYRDIWDLRWLSQKGIEPNLEWIASKINDYQIADFHQRWLKFRSRATDVIHSDAFRNEMTRFIPQAQLERTLDQPKFLAYLTEEILSLLNSLQTLR